LAREKENTSSPASDMIRTSSLYWNASILQVV